MSFEISDCDEDSAIAGCQHRYRINARADLKANGVSWPIIPDRRWVAESDEDGSWIVSAYESPTAMSADKPIARWRIGGRRLVRLG